MLITPFPEATCPGAFEVRPFGIEGRIEQK